MSWDDEDYNYADKLDKIISLLTEIVETILKEKTND